MSRICSWVFPAVFIGGSGDANFSNPYAAFELDRKRGDSLLPGQEYLVYAKGLCPGSVLNYEWFPDFQQNFNPDFPSYISYARESRVLPRHRHNLHDATEVKSVKISKKLYCSMLDEPSVSSVQKFWDQARKQFLEYHLGCISFDVES